MILKNVNVEVTVDILPEVDTTDMIVDLDLDSELVKENLIFLCKKYEIDINTDSVFFDTMIDDLINLISDNIYIEGSVNVTAT